jgi:hypothetical protein
MARIPIHPGTVDWSGENPGISLKETADGPFACLVSFFRVIYSPHGRGHAAFVLLEPDRRAGPDRNFCLTDNPDLAAYLKDGFVANFGAYRDNPNLADLAIRPATDFRCEGDLREGWTERCAGDGLEVALRWGRLSTPFWVELSADRSATGKHEMLSLFFDADEAEVSVNGQRAPGKPVPRDFQGRPSSTAFIAVSETWVKVG